MDREQPARGATPSARSGRSGGRAARCSGGAAGRRTTCMDGGRGMRLPNTAHTSWPWRIHELTRDFRLEDVWALPTPGGPHDFLALCNRSPQVAPPGAPLAPPAALDDPLEGRRATRLGRAGRRRRLQAADAPRPVANGPAQRPSRPRVREAPVQVALPARRRVGSGDRQPDHARGDAHRLGPRRRRKLPRPDGRARET